jgi:acetylglutamate kinase
MSKQELLYRFFEFTGNEKDSLIYLKTFREIQPESFALLYCNSLCFSETGESLLYDLKLLQQLELYPVVVLHQSVLEYIKVFYGKNINFDLELSQNSLNVRVVSSNSSICSDEIKEAIFNKKIPIVPITESEDEIFNILKIIKDIIKIINSKKIIYLTPERLFQTENQYQISMINYSNLESLDVAIDSLSSFEKTLISLIKDLLTESKSFLKSASVTTPISLFKELFTIKGNGTYFKLGSEIIKTNLSDINKEKLKKLLEASFHRPIKNEFLDSKIDSILLESEYRGAAILKETKYGTLLTKFAVDEIARGEGIGREIWDKMKNESEVIFWRANKQNPINKWYFKECDGMIKTENWNIYWIGLHPNYIQLVVDYLCELPGDFYE